LVGRPPDQELPLTSVVIFDPADLDLIRPGTIVLCPASLTGGDNLALLLPQLADRVATAVVCDPQSIRPETVAAAGPDSVAVLGRAPGTPWGQLYSSLRTWLAAAPDPAWLTAGDMFSIAGALADMLGGHVLIEDAQGQVVAYSGDAQPVDDVRREAIVGHRTPGPWQERLRREGVLHKLSSSDDVVRYDADGQIRPRLAVAVRAGDELLGSVWLIEGSRPFDDSTVRDVRDAATQVAPHLVRHRLLASTVHHQRGALFAAVLTGRLPPETLLMPSGLGGDGCFAVVTLRVDEPGPDAALLASLEKVMSLVTMHCAAFRRPVLCTSLGRLVYLFLTDAVSGEPGQFTEFTRQLVAKLRPVVAVTAGVGSVQSRISHLQLSRTSADRVLQALALHPSLGPVANEDSAASQLALLEVAERLLDRPSSFLPAVRALITHDAGRRSDYADTLLAYLDHFGDVNGAAEHVGIHPNTFRYRMRRLVQLAEIDLQNCDQRLAIQMQLRALRPLPRPARLRALMDRDRDSSG
jgi:hypothetical protein